MHVAKLKTSLAQKIGNMEDSNFEFYDRDGHYEGFGAFMWLCISTITGLAMITGVVLFSIFC